MRVRLPQPLTPGAPTVVTVRAGGVAAGHAGRAFPCFSQVGFCGANCGNLPELARYGLRYFAYAYPDAGALDAYLGQPALSSAAPTRSCCCSSASTLTRFSASANPRP